MEEQRRLLERRARRMGKRKNVQLDIEKVLGISPTWWGEELSDPNFDFDAEDEDEAPDDTVFVRFYYGDCKTQSQIVYRLLRLTITRCSYSPLLHYPTFFNPSLPILNRHYGMPSQPTRCTC